MSIKVFIKWYWNARSTKGYGIHSPLVFQITRDAYRDRVPFYCFSEIEKERKKLLYDKSIIEVNDLGSGSRVLKSTQRQISRIAKTSLLPSAQAQILFRLINMFECRSIIELGTSLGISTAYMASVDSNSVVDTFEGCPNLAQKASKVFNNLGLSNINQHIGNIDSKLPEVLDKTDKIDFVYIDANHCYEATLSYFNHCLPKLHNKSIVVIGDIHLNDEMEQAWKEITQNQKVAFSIDNWHMGALFFDKRMPVQHFTIRALQMR